MSPKNFLFSVKNLFKRLPVLKLIVKIAVAIFVTFFLFESSLRILSLFNSKVKYFLYSSRYDLNLSKIKNSSDLIKNAPCPLKPLSNVNGFIINGKGFYTPDYQTEKPNKTLRIGFIGDSFTTGVVPYTQNFITLFAQKTKDLNKDKQVEVINWGMPCLGPQYEEKILEVEGFKSKPDYLVWMFFVGNDFTDELAPGEKLPLTNLLTKNIYTLRLLRNMQKSIQGLQLSRETTQKAKIYKKGGVYIGDFSYDDEKPTFSQEQYLRIQTEKLSLFSAKFFPALPWQGIQKTLSAFKGNCETNRVKCLIVIIPDENQVNEELLNKVVSIQGIRKDDLILDYPQKLITEFFKENNFLYLDLLPVFKENGQTKKLYHPADTHWNIAGNELAAEEIFNYFKKNQ